MSGHTKWSVIEAKLVARPGAAEAIARASVELDEEIRQYNVRRADAIRTIDENGELRVTRDDVVAFEHIEDVSIAVLRDYLDTIGARLELVAWFDEPDRRVPIELT
jgi:hypothetical protein